MKVSIIIPIYNVAPYVEACLLSVFNQTYKEIEIIIIDDCGTDNSMEIVERIVSTYDGEFSIKILHHNQNKGLSAARNTGIKEATGEYLFFLDSDDTIPNDAIDNLVQKVLTYTNVSFVIGGIQTIGYRRQRYPLLCPELQKEKFILIDFLSHKWNEMACNKLINKAFFIQNQLWFMENVYHEDIDFTFRLAICAKTMACCNNITYNYLIRDKSITTNKNLKNYIDECNIHKQNLLTLIRQDYKPYQTIISKYAIDISFSYIVSLIREKNRKITIKDKKELIYHLLQISQKTISIHNLSFAYVIKNIFLHLPFSLQYCVANIYSDLKKRN